MLLAKISFHYWKPAIMCYCLETQQTDPPNYGAHTSVARHDSPPVDVFNRWYDKAVAIGCPWWLVVVAENRLARHFLRAVEVFSVWTMFVVSTFQRSVSQASMWYLPCSFAGDPLLHPAVSLRSSPVIAHMLMARCTRETLAWLGTCHPASRIETGESGNDQRTKASMPH